MGTSVNLKMILLGVAASVGVGAALAQQADTPRSRVPTHTPEFTQPTTGDPAKAASVAADLQRIVVLCATKPGSQEFESAWTEYVRAHYRRGENVDALIEDVLRRAAAHRTGTSDAARSRAPVSVDSATTRKRMHDTAMAVIRKIG